MIAVLALAAMAQDVEFPDMNAQLYRPPIDSRTTLWTEDTTVAESGTAQGRLQFQYLNRPLVWVPNEGDAVVGVSDVLQVDLAGGYSVGPMRFGLSLPVYLYATGLAGSATGIGDVQLDVKGRVLDRTTAPLGLALDARLSVPSATPVLPLGDPGVDIELAALLDVELGGFVVAGNLGTRIRPRNELSNVTLNDQLFFRLGESYAISDAGGVSFDLAGQFNYSSPLTNEASIPLEGLLGGWYRPGGGNWVARGGVGTGFTPGIGSPVARVLLGVAYEPTGKDTDGDGIMDRNDSCPLDPEDPDQWEDSDGCPDVDNDGDGILDGSDGCPNDAEDVDSIEDADGCPEPAMPVVLRLHDPDGRPVAGVTATLDNSPIVETDTATFDLVLPPGIYAVGALAKGYEPLSEKFTIPEGTKAEIVEVMTPAVPMGAVAVSVFDQEGNPIPSATWQIDAGRKNPTTDDTLSLPPGEYVVTVRADGYATAYAPADVRDHETTRLTFSLARPKVIVTEERVDLKEKVFFDTNKATIKKESYPLLEEVAQVLKDHPEITKIRIEGHTDSRGSDTSNQLLSEKRAKSVLEFLATHGVERDRMESIGYGESRPLDPAETPEAWEKNRRVDIFIVDRKK